jgi:hypothetical protein
MAYTKTAWVDDDGSSTVGTLVTAARMNKIEQGVFDASLDAAPFVTVLPVAPVDGQEVSFVSPMGVGIANYCNATWYQQFNGRALAFGKAKNALAQLGFLSAATSVTFQSSERHLFVTPVRVG